MKHKFLAKRYWKSETTPMGASDVLAKSFDDVINLSLGDPDIITDNIIIDKAFSDAKAGHTKYTSFQGDPELRAEIASFYKTEYGMNVRDSEIMVTTSGCIAMYLALEAIIDDGDEVIIHTPCFTPYPEQVALARGIPVYLETTEADGFQINARKLEKKITERTRAVIINSPTNPTGAFFSNETLKGIADVAAKHDLIVIADDIYTLYCFEKPFIPIASFSGMFERTITINSFSKNFMMTGWRVGNIVAPDYIITAIRQINENVAFTSPSISQRAALHGLRQRSEIQPKLMKEFRDRVFTAAERINKIPNMSVMRPQGTFYLFPNIKKTGLSSAEVADKILKEAHVLVLPGTAFGAAGEGYIRVACTCPAEKLSEAFDRIARMDIFR